MLQTVKENADILLGAQTREEDDRNRGIVRTSVVGILTNLLLTALKAVVGIFSNSIAIVLDAVNNLSDAASSIITIVGTKLAGKPADKKHPFGYGRIEYLSAMVISLIILYAGITSLVESVKKIVSPTTPDYSIPSLVIVASGIVVKIALGLYVKSRGRRFRSESLVNSGEDAMLDSIISAATLVAAIVYLAFGLSLESYLGAVISVVVIKSGIEMLMTTLSEILGERAEPSLAAKIKQTVNSFDGVHGAYDLILNNYGPDSFNGSIHIEVPDSYTAEKIDGLVRSIQTAVYEKHNVILTAIGVYSYNEKDTEAASMRNEILKIARSHKHVLQMHGFYLNRELKTIRFDLVVSFDSDDRRKVFIETVDEIKAKYPEYSVLAALDTDFSELEQSR